MPFGLDLKSIIIGIILGIFVVPRVLALVTSMRSGGTTAAA